MNIEFLFELLFLPGIFVAGVFSSLSDIKTGKITNKLIKKCFLYGLIIYFLIIAWSLFGKYIFYDSQFFYLKFNYFTDFIINLGIAFIIGFLFWKFDMWAAADAKLFMLFSFLIPLTAYRFERMPYFPSFVLLVNIYTVCLIYLIFSYLWKAKIKIGNIKDFLKKIPHALMEIRIIKILDFLAFSAVIIAFAFFIFSTAANYFKISDSLTILLYIVIILISAPVKKLLGKYKKTGIFIILLSLIYLASWFVSDAQSAPVIAKIILYMVSINLAFKLLFSFSASDQRSIDVKDLKKNMILTAASLDFLRRNGEFYGNLGEIYPDGLSAEQVEKIRNFFDEKNLKTIEIHKTFAFAPFVFIGVLITLIIGGSLIGWLLLIL